MYDIVKDIAKCVTFLNIKSGFIALNFLTYIQKSNFVLKNLKKLNYSYNNS